MLDVRVARRMRRLAAVTDRLTPIRARAWIVDRAEDERLRTDARVAERAERGPVWSWNELGRRPFAMLDPKLWEATRHSPKKLIQQCDPARLSIRANTPEFQQIVERAMVEREKYYERNTWFQRIATEEDTDLQVAYFCSEFAIHESMQQYSGGLGVLAGDHVKSASDLGVPFVGVSLLYGHGYYIQEFSGDGHTRVLYPKYDFEDMPIEDTGSTSSVRSGIETSWRVSGR